MVVFLIANGQIPFSGRNPNFKHRLLGLKPHILVLNKVDLVDIALKEKIVKSLKKEGITDVIFTCCKKEDSDGIKDVSSLINVRLFESNFLKNIVKMYAL